MLVNCSGAQQPLNRPWPIALLRYTPVLVPSIIFGLHSFVFGSWVIDDAAISFAYARNLAAGNGLVAQPGTMPVEGFSNPLWVFAMALLDLFHAFDPVVTPKLVAIGCVFLAFYILVMISENHHTVGVALSLLS